MLIIIIKVAETNRYGPTSFKTVISLTKPSFWNGMFLNKIVKLISTKILYLFRM